MAGLSNMLGGVYGDDEPGSEIEEFASATLDLEDGQDETVVEWSFDEDDEDEVVSDAGSPADPATDDLDDLDDFDDLFAAMDDDTIEEEVSAPDPAHADVEAPPAPEVTADADLDELFAAVESEPAPPAADVDWLEEATEVPSWDESDSTENTWSEELIEEDVVEEEPEPEPSTVYVRSDDDILPPKAKGRGFRRR